MAYIYFLKIFESICCDVDFLVSFDDFRDGNVFMKFAVGCGTDQLVER